MTSDLSALASIAFIKPLSSHSDFRNWLLAATNIFAEKEWLALIEGKEPRPAATKEDTGSARTSCTPSASTSSGASIDTNLDESQQAWDTKATKVRGLLGRMLDANHREMYSTERDPVTVWKMLKERYQGKDKQRIWFLRSTLSKVQYQREDMSEFISKLQKLLNQLLSDWCTAYEDDDKIFLLLNTLPMEYHPFRTSITNAESLTFEEVSSRLILEHEKLAGGKVASRRRVAFYAENGKPSKVVHNQRRGNSSKDTCSYCHFKGHWAKDCKKRIAREDRRGQGSANARQAVAWMVQVNAQDIAYSPPTLDWWIVDSGASHHITSQQSYFSTYYHDSTTVTLANNRILKAAGRGDVVVLLPSGDITLKDVLHIPSLGFSSLLSLRLIHQSGCQIVFNQPGSGPPNGDFEGADHVMHILNGPDIIATATLIGHSCVLHTKMNPNVHAAFATASVPIRSSPIQHPLRKSADSLFQWHLHLGHIGFEGIKQLAKDPASGIKLTSTAIEACAACLQGKQTRHPLSKPVQRALNTLDTVHSDLCGPITPQSLGGAKYYISFRDDATSWMELEPIKKKSDAFGSIKKYFAQCEAMHGVKIKAFHSDNGAEFTSHAFEEFLAASGCKHEVSGADSQEQNGVAERVNRMIVGRAKAMLYGAQLPLFLWAEAARTAGYNMNQTPTRSQTKTPYEL